ncbi:hypothetical protein Ancab_028681 [Ancistrocladus abbreviatus]
MCGGVRGPVWCGFEHNPNQTAILRFGHFAKPHQTAVRSKPHQTAPQKTVWCGLVYGLRDCTISALRDCTISGELDKIVRVGDEFRFGNAYAFLCNIETAYRSKQGNLYTLKFLATTSRILSTCRMLSGKVSPSLHCRIFAPCLTTLKAWSLPPTPLKSYPAPLLHLLQDRRLPTEEPQFLSLRSLAAAMSNNESNQVDIDDDFSVPVSENVDFMVLIEAVQMENSLLLCKNRDFYRNTHGCDGEREEKRQRLESQQRKDGLVAKSRLMGAEER